MAANRRSMSSPATGAPPNQNEMLMAVYGSLMGVSNGAVQGKLRIRLERFLIVASPTRVDFLYLTGLIVLSGVGTALAWSIVGDFKPGYARLSARGFRDGEYGTVSCARVFLSAALVTARHTVSGEVVTLQVPPRLMQIDAAKQANAWETPDWKRQRLIVQPWGAWLKLWFSSAGRIIRLRLSSRRPPRAVPNRTSRKLARRFLN